MPEGTETLARILTKRQWREQRAAHLFPTDSSLEWFVRKHYDLLVSEKAYIVRGGRSPALCTGRMDTLVAEILLGE